MNKTYLMMAAALMLTTVVLPGQASALTCGIPHGPYVSDDVRCVADSNHCLSDPAEICILVNEAADTAADTAEYAEATAYETIGYAIGVVGGLAHKVHPEIEIIVR